MNDTPADRPKPHVHEGVSRPVEMGTGLSPFEGWECKHCGCLMAGPEPTPRPGSDD